MSNSELSVAEECQDSTDEESRNEEHQHSSGEIAPGNETEGVNDKEKDRCTRKEYQNLISETNEKGPDFLNESIKKASVLIKRVKKPREAIFDSKLANIQASFIKQKTQSLQSNLLEFRPDEFAAKFETLINSSKFGTPRKRTHSEMFVKFGKISKRILPTPPPFYPLFNTLEKVDKPIIKKTRQTKQKDEVSKIVQKPKSIDSSGKGNSEESDVAERILSILHKVYDINKRAICYFSFVVNPFSFSETIENIFYVSILAKEGGVEIYPGKDGLPYIEPIAFDQMTNVKLHGNYTQAIISLDENDWKAIAKEFGSEKPIITRKKPASENNEGRGESSGKRKR